MSWFRVKGRRVWVGLGLSEDGYGLVQGYGKMGMGWFRVKGRRVWVGFGLRGDGLVYG